MQAEELTRIRFRGTHRVTVVPSPTGELILLEGTSCTVLDDELEQTAAFEVGALGHDLTVIALDGAVLLGTEDALRLWSFGGKEKARLPLEPWGGGLRGSVASISGAIWSVHFPQEPGDAQLRWVLARLSANDLTITHQADLSHLGAHQFGLFDLGQGRVGVDLFRAPDYLGTLCAHLDGAALALSEVTASPPELEAVVGSAHGKLLARTYDDVILADALTLDVVARSARAETFGTDESGGSRDDPACLLQGPAGRLLLYTTLGHLGELRVVDGRLRFDRLALPGVEVERATMRMSDVTTGFEGVVTREQTNVNRVLEWGDRYLTVHSGKPSTDAELRVWKLSDGPAPAGRT